MEKKKKPEISTALIEEEYMTHLDTDNDELYWAKEALRNALTPYQRKIYITYCETETYSGTARLFNTTAPTVKTYIAGLQIKISDYICQHLK